ncbi:PIG-L family deacetylase [Angustibacter sp. McL0619]|uniref:PIG-L family deacetylase n=1 Tax=Angustibacter sp. McL0619 TaxID=3415676 RepID=UPI003CEEF554
MTFTHDGTGTPEGCWQESAVLHALPVADLAGAVEGRRLLVLAAHPDDETLGAGGLIATAGPLAASVVVVVATAGERSHPGSPTTSTDELALRRSAELREAVRRLDPGARLHELDLPDGTLSRRPDTLAEQVVALARRLLDADGAPPLLVSPWRGDGHPDHEAVGAAAVAVSAQLGCELLEYPLWAWHWADPGHPALPWPTAARLPLPDSARRRKREAVRAHVSQLVPLSDQPGDEALLLPGVLEHFDRPYEVYFRTPAPSSLDAEYFTDLYHREGPDPWGLAERWYEQRKRALLMAALPRPRFRRVFEPGCSIGMTTAALAERCDEVLALDPVAAAVDEARRRTGAMANVQVQRGRVPADWPPGAFDLVVLSEIGYYCSAHDLALLARRCVDSLDPDGVLAICHWRHPASDHLAPGDHVHQVLRDRTGLTSLVQHIEEDFLLDVLVPPPGGSVARRTGVL